MKQLSLFKATKSKPFTEIVFTSTCVLYTGLVKLSLDNRQLKITNPENGLDIVVLDIAIEDGKAFFKQLKTAGWTEVKLAFSRFVIAVAPPYRVFTHTMSDQAIIASTSFFGVTYLQLSDKYVFVRQNTLADDIFSAKLKLF